MIWGCSRATTMESRVSRETSAIECEEGNVCSTQTGSWSLSTIYYWFYSAPSFRSFRRTSQLISHSTYRNQLSARDKEWNERRGHQFIEACCCRCLSVSFTAAHSMLWVCFSTQFDIGQFMGRIMEREPRKMLETREQLAERIDCKFLIQFPNCLNEFRVKFFLLDFCSNNNFFWRDVRVSNSTTIKTRPTPMIKDFALNFSSDEPTSRDDKNRQSIFVMQILKFHQLSGLWSVFFYRHPIVRVKRRFLRNLHSPPTE